MLTAIRKNGTTLALFACASTGLVAVTNYLTADKIAEQERKQLITQLNQVIPHELHDNALHQECTLVRSDLLGTAESMPVYIAKINGQPSGAAVEAIAPDGYNGSIKIIVGMDINGTVTGSRVLAHNETPGLGDKIDIRVTDWILGFNGKTVTAENRDDWKVKKDGGQFDQFTGATITPRAVVKAVKNSVTFYKQNQSTLFSQPLNCGEKDD
ncbi:electron transport complex subunit RsxG [Vibrio sp. JC009]|uniref:electron transport complex subunit RsxG n=1 Tax=Vibrio sp. JC009 TaxID=2912314 RepID=UPI0023AF521A|nr:electron transport complex subunit RsxG [Vibrio sp. JC009]WED20908.1 electron transport complex subunit RsxG [Vibrio sp. JC009]